MSLLCPNYKLSAIEGQILWQSQILLCGTAALLIQVVTTNIITIIMQERSDFKPYSFVIAIQEAANNCSERVEIRMRLIRVLGRGSPEIQARIDEDLAAAKKLNQMAKDILEGSIERSSLN